MEKWDTSYYGLGHIKLLNNIKNVTIVFKRICFLTIFLLLMTTLYSCKSKGLPKNYVYVLENGEVFDSNNTKVADLVDYNAEIPIITLPSKQGYIYVSSTFEGDLWSKYEMCFVDMEFNITRQINIVDYLQTSYYPELQSKKQICLIPNAVTVYEDKAFFIASIDESQKGVFLIDLQKKDSKLLFVDYIYGEKISISENGKDLFFSQKQDNKDVIMKYNLCSKETSIYKDNSKELVFSPNYQYEIYLETDYYKTQIGKKGTKHNYSQNLIVRDIHSGEEVYRENECALYEYEFSYDSKGIVCKETMIRHLSTQYENRTRCTYIDINSGDTFKICQSDWGTQINQVLLK